MSRHQWEGNLGLLSLNLEEYASSNGIPQPNPSSPAATSLSDSLYLAHSTSDNKFSAVCASGFVASAAGLAAASGAFLASGCTELLMGTADSVFFYVSPFRYPHTGCGLLFAKTLESYHADDGVATPFDSGGLLSVYTRTDTTEPPQGFLSRHELPVPEHRSYLRLSMSVLFHKPADYVEGTGPSRPGPLGLTGGDYRRWTHEVRIPDKVFVRGSHIQAVFAPRARVAGDPEIESLFQWCVGEGVDNIMFDTPRGNDFEALRRECLAYIRRKLY